MVGQLTLDGRRVPPRPPYNLRTGFDAMLIRKNYFRKNRFLSFLYAPLHYLYDVAYRNNKFYRSLVLNLFR